MANALFQTSLVLPPVASADAGAFTPATEKLCAGDVPLVLLPVRLETRFFAHPSGVELRVRVYPDKIHCDSHELELLPEEHRWGVHYWEQDWRAGSDAAARANAWRQLAERFGDKRAAWILRQLTPTNPSQRPEDPVPADDALPTAPELPHVTVVNDGKDSAWRHAAQAKLLPDRWVGVLRARNGTQLRFTGRDIAGPLAVGPDPQAGPLGEGQSAVEDGMRWMVDFERAEQQGMAMRIVVPSVTLNAGLDSLFVLGVSASRSATAAAADLADLLDAHHYTDGLQFLAQGTPTNHAPERRAGSASDAAGHERSFADEVANQAQALDPLSNAVSTGTALGLPAGRIAPVLGHLERGSDAHERDLRSMNTALWQAGWGYFLSNIIGFEGSDLTAESLEWARQHFVSHVRAGGPLPVLRCGRQPYGILPVTSLDLWSPAPGEEPLFARDLWLRDVLRKLRENLWRPSLGSVARIGRRQSPADPDADLADVMRTDAVSEAFDTRSLFGADYVLNLRAFAGEDLRSNNFDFYSFVINDSIERTLALRTRPAGVSPPGFYGIPARLAAGALLAERTWPVSAPLVQAGEVSPWRKLEPDYIGALLAAPSIEGLIQLRPGSAAPTQSLLDALLRHSMLREYAHAAALLAASLPGMSFGALLRDEELVDLITGAAPTLTWKRQLDLKVPGITGEKTIRQFLESATAFDSPQLAALGDLRRSLSHLHSLDSERLQVLLQGTLDLSSHRLDAWITSYASKRLASMRASRPVGAYVGGYGWVENLQPALSGPTPQPPASGLPLAMPQTNDTGFIHAPSMTHAAAAALLRNAHLGPNQWPQPSSPFAINLTSRRVREATRLLDGVRQGQPLGALLGYRLERSLHERSLDRFIARLRRMAPLSASKLPAGGPSSESIAASNVVDGLTLQRKWRDEKSALTASLQAAGPNQEPGASADELQRLSRELDGLTDSIDAVSDALTAEAAYQVARGNTSRLASTFESIASGAAPPPELEVTQMPRSGTALTHRLLALWNSPTPASSGWPSNGESLRAAAEPTLAAWAAKLLGDARRIRCSVERLDDASAAVVEAQSFVLFDLRLGALDVVYGVEATHGSAPEQVEQRVLHHARSRPGGFGAAANLRIQHDRPANLAAGELTLLDALELARSARKLLSGARGAEPEDLNPPERAEAGTLDLGELEGRVVRAEDSLLDLHKALGTLIEQGDAASVAALRAALLRLDGFGIANAIPVVASGEDASARATTLVQSAAVQKTVWARCEQFLAQRGAPAASETRARHVQLLERMRSVFGPGFVTLPRFTCETSAAAELAGALSASTQTQAGDPLAAHGWLARCARVREGVARLGACLRSAEVLGSSERLDLCVAQLPFVSGERWVGLPPAAGKDLPAGKLSLVLQGCAALDTTQPLAGLWVDEWVEVVPSRRETTAVTFQFDPPDACAPQSVLVAVPPVPGQDWTVSTLHRVLLETLDLAKLRAVNPELLGAAAQFRPGPYLAFNAQDDAVSTDFAPLTQ